MVLISQKPFCCHGWLASYKSKLQTCWISTVVHVGIVISSRFSSCYY